MSAVSGALGLSLAWLPAGPAVATFCAAAVLPVVAVARWTREPRPRDLGAAPRSATVDATVRRREPDAQVAAGSDGAARAK